MAQRRSILQILEQDGYMVGSSLRDPYALGQGWKPTMGCTRAQNEDVDELCKKGQVGCIRILERN